MITCEFCRDLRANNCPACYPVDMTEQVTEELFRTEGEPRREEDEDLRARFNHWRL